MDVIREHITHKEEDDEDDGSGAEGGKKLDAGKDPDLNEEGGQAIAKRVKRGVQNRLA